MKTCETCAYWGAERSPGTLLDRRRCYAATPVGSPFGFDTPAVVVTTGEIISWAGQEKPGARLYTLPTFGCTMHEEKS